jgi:hypothetical protein
MHEEKKEKEIDKNKLKIVEGAASVWHYHLSETGKNGFPSLCGRYMVMHTEIPLSTWGKKGGHIPCSYCEECDAILQSL